MTIKLRAGDKVTFDWRANTNLCGAKTGTVFDHPSNPEWVVIVSDDTSSNDAFSSLYKRDGCDLFGNSPDVTPVDEAREAWDKLEPYVRDMLSHLARGVKGSEWYATIPGQKVPAIKFLRAATGLGLADAKRAIEQFT